VERQYDALKRERMRLLEDQNKPQAQQQPQPPQPKPAEEVPVQANAAQPAGNSEMPPAESQSTSEVRSGKKRSAVAKKVTFEMDARSDDE
jgi:hypothetical protein